MKKPLAIMVITAVVTWFAAMGIHNAQAKPLKATGAHTEAGYMLAMLAYDARGGLLAIAASPADGPLIFKDEKECTAARDSKEGQEMLKMTLLQITERAHRSLRSINLCLPIDAPGERID